MAALGDRGHRREQARLGSGARSRPAPPAPRPARSAQCGPPTTVICWPTIARMSISCGSAAPGTRMPGTRATSGASSGCRASASSIAIGSASRSNRRRARVTSVDRSPRCVSRARSRTRPTSSRRSSNHAGPPASRSVRANDVARRRLDAADRAGAHPGEQARRRRTARGAAAPGRSRRAPPRRVRPAAARAQLERRHPEHLAHGLVELADAREPGRERDVGRGQVGADEQHPGGVRAVGAAERERPRAEFGGEQPGEVPRGVSEPPREPRHALALDDAVGDEPHRARGGVAAQVPLGRSGRRLGQAALARPVARFVRGRAGGVERDVRGLRRAGGAARAAVDAGRAHRRDELPVEAGIARLDHAVPLVEGHARDAHVHQPATTRSTRLAEIGHGGAAGPSRDRPHRVAVSR